LITFDVTDMCKQKDYMIYNSKQLYFSISYKNVNFFMFSFIFIFCFFIERSRATSRGLADHFWPVGHRLGNPLL